MFITERRFRDALAQAQHSESLLRESFEIQIKALKQGHEDELRKLRIDHEDAFRALKNQYEEKRVKESLELQVKTSQQIIDSEKKLNSKIHELEMEKANFRSQLEKEFYSKMKDSLEDLHTKGNSTTNFVQEMALKMLDVKREHLQIEAKASV